MPMDKTFGQRLKTLRKKAGLTQEKLAELVDVSLMTVRRWETMQRSPRMDEIKKISTALNISEDTLFYEPNNEKWILTIKIADDKKEVIHLSQNVPVISNFEITPYGGNFLVSASWHLLEDENAFQDLLTQLIDVREEILRTGKAMYKKVWSQKKDFNNDK